MLVRNYRDKRKNGVVPDATSNEHVKYEKVLLFQQNSYYIYI